MVAWGLVGRGRGIEGFGDVERCKISSKKSDEIFLKLIILVNS
jgi:hypothetical protein